MGTNDYLKTKGQLGRPDDQRIYVQRATDKVKVFDKPLVVLRNTVNPAYTWGNSTWNGTVWTADNIVSANLITRIVNKDNIFYERFVNDILKISTTGTWDTTNKRLVLADGEEATGYYFANVINITNSTMVVTGEIDNALLYLSSDGTNYESVSNNIKHGFTNVGQAGKWKIVASGDTVTADLIRISYNN